MSEKSILILGEADAGKTHYGAQLMIRLEGRKCAAHYFAPPENVEPFADAMKDLNNGKAAGHTSGQATKQSVLPIEFPGNLRVNIAWPEYAGERLKDLVHSRHAGDGWRRSAAESEAWLLMLRHDAFKQERDLLNRPVSEWMAKRKNPNEGPVDWAPQARTVELLQMMLFFRQTGHVETLRLPRLAVAMSCYDTLPQRDRFKQPDDALRMVAPMVAAFIASNWQTGNYFVVGLSSTGRTLDKTKPDEDFINTGPASNGWVVTPKGEQISDLTWPLVELLRA
jgi:hypothetical protein